ncbi:adenylosuccinate synthase [candidate division FCPU426 bacterium]|nr:adenylosuccinate synthase [candidate division FCPU426 bacterium]
MPNLVIVGAQWGDEGKGKVIDLLTEHADAVVRFQGGNNAGHTVVFGGQKQVLHLIPCGILHEGKICVIGNGVVVDPDALIQEIEQLQTAGFHIGENLKISNLSPVTFAFHRALDKAKEMKRGKEKIDTTHRGIGPTYADKYSRLGIRMIDLLDEKRLRNRLEQTLDEKNYLFKHYFALETFKINDLLVEYLALGEKLRPHVTDTAFLINTLLAEGKNVLFEGAQGTYLDVDFGTYPFVTSSHPIAGGASIGTGVGPTRIDEVLGVAKAYATRVGAGPFPTEWEGGGEALRQKGNEFGATTGRPRRCGWFDAITVRRAAMINGFEQMALTKLDILSGFSKIKICIGYKIEGRLQEDFPASAEEMDVVEPVYQELDGWQEDISAIKEYEKLPENTKKYISEIEKRVGVKITIISLGEDRKQTILLRSFFK